MTSLDNARWARKSQKIYRSKVVEKCMMLRFLLKTNNVTSAPVWFESSRVMNRKNPENLITDYVYILI